MRENDVVVLLEDLPCGGLKKGTHGVIVAVYTDTESVFEVEFCGNSGETIASVALSANQLTKVWDSKLQLWLV